MFTGPVGPVEVLFYWPKAIFGNFYWPGAIGPLLALSPDFQTNLPDKAGMIWPFGCCIFLSTCLPFHLVLRNVRN